MDKNKDTKPKSLIDFLQAHSLRDLLYNINTYNVNNPEHPILKDDIVDIFKEEDTYILLYYK